MTEKSEQPVCKVAEQIRSEFAETGYFSQGDLNKIVGDPSQTVEIQTTRPKDPLAAMISNYRQA